VCRARALHHGQQGWGLHGFTRIFQEFTWISGLESLQKEFITGFTG
jgi:hypothetical protein